MQIKFNQSLFTEKVYGKPAAMIKRIPAWRYEPMKMRHCSVRRDEQLNRGIFSRVCVYFHSMTVCTAKPNNWAERAPPSGCHSVCRDGGRPLQVRKYRHQLKARQVKWRDGGTGGEEQFGRQTCGGRVRQQRRWNDHSFEDLPNLEEEVFGFEEGTFLSGLSSYSVQLSPGKRTDMTPVFINSKFWRKT